MKFVALLLLPIAASSGSSASAFYDGPQDQVQVTQAVGQQTGARSLRGRQKRRPCAKSIATYCSTAKNAAAKQACLRSKLFGNLLDPRCEALVERRADALNACRSVAAAVGCAQGPVPIACMQRRYRKAGADTLLAGTACAVALDRLAGHKAASQASNRAADERQARIAAILKAMPPAEVGDSAQIKSRGTYHIDATPARSHWLICAHRPAASAASTRDSWPRPTSRTRRRGPRPTTWRSAIPRRRSPTGLTSKRPGWGTAPAAPAGPPGRLRARAWARRRGRTRSSRRAPSSRSSSSARCRAPRRRRPGTRPRSARGPTRRTANTAATTRTRSRWSASE